MASTATKARPDVGKVGYIGNIKLSQDDFQRLIWHLGYNISVIPATDWGKLVEAANNLPGRAFHDRITERLNRCDRAERASELLSVPRTRTESIAGDVIRTIAITNAAEAARIYPLNYLDETNELAYSLHVPNYRDPLQAQVAWRRNGPEYATMASAPSDTAVSERIRFSRSWGGG
jgi:hypothetical protein